MFPSLEVYGSKVDDASGVTKFVDNNQEFRVGSLTFTALLTPGHTTGHLTYRLHGVDKNPDMIFTGDLLFLCGIGKMFEGSARTTLSSLDTLCALSDDTLVWPGHEYAVDNFKFAAAVDPENKTLKEKRHWVHAQRGDALPTCPSTLAEEKQYNPFLRTADARLLRLLDDHAHEEDVSAPPRITDDTNVVGHATRVHALKTLRRLKDEFVENNSRQLAAVSARL